MAKNKTCTSCGSDHIVMNGQTDKGKQKFHCKECGCYRTFGTTQYYTKERKEEIIRAYQERASLRGVHRVYGTAITSVLRWIKKKSNSSQDSQIRFFQLCQMTSQNTMKSGHLSTTNLIGFGYRPAFAGELVKQSHIILVIEMRQVLTSFTKKSHLITPPAEAGAISCKSTRESTNSSTNCVGKRQVKPPRSKHSIQY